MSAIELGLLNIPKSVKQLGLNHIFSIINRCTPDYLSANFTKVSDVHKFITIALGAVPTIFMSQKGNSIPSSLTFYNSINDWSSLPNSIENIT